MQYLDVLLDALIDTAKILPILFATYYLIELIEYKFAYKFQKNKLLNGKLSPVVGSLMGCVPQCGFSVISTDLYTKRVVSIGALIAVFIATSDEAIPLMIASPSSIPWMLLLIALKIVFGILIGYLAMFLFKTIFKNKNEQVQNIKTHKHDESDHQHENNETLSEHGGCCHHKVETKSFDWLHPLLHCLKITAFVFAINVIFGFITHIWVGEENLTNFLSQSVCLQPILAVVIGLIPNCASSVVLTELFIMGGLKFSALLAGLCVNAGLGLIMLLRLNKNWKENLFILSMLIIPSVLLGYALLFI